MTSARDAILALADATPEMEPLEGMDGAFVRRLSVADSEAMSKLGAENRGMALFVHTVCAENGELLFSMKDAAKLKKLPLKTFNDYGKQILAFNGLAPNSAEDAEKNSDPATADD